MMNYQEVFETMVTGLYKQGGPSIDPDNRRCAYRNGKGDKCAIGFLIDDSEYDPCIESKSVFGSLLNKILKKKYNIVDEEPVDMVDEESVYMPAWSPEIKFLDRCQRTLHDDIRNITDPKLFRIALIENAKFMARMAGIILGYELNLDISFIDNLKE